MVDIVLTVTLLGLTVATLLYIVACDHLQTDQAAQSNVAQNERQGS